MTVPPTSPPPTAVPTGAIAAAQLTEAAKQQAVATLASAIIIASGRPHSIREAIEIARDVRFALYPTPQLEAYKEWEKTKDARLARVHGKDES
jgi:hypothetical protein